MVKLFTRQTVIESLRKSEKPCGESIASTPDTHGGHSDGGPLFFISCQQAWQLVREQLQMTRATDTPSRTATEGVQLTASSQFTHPGILNHTFHLDQARQDSSSQ